MNKLHMVCTPTAVRLGTLSLALSLGGCSLVPTYERPAAPVAPSLLQCPPPPLPAL